MDVPPMDSAAEASPLTQQVVCHISTAADEVRGAVTAALGVRRRGAWLDILLRHAAAEAGPDGMPEWMPEPVRRRPRGGGEPRTAIWASISPTGAAAFDQLAAATGGARWWIVQALIEHAGQVLAESGDLSTWVAQPELATQGTLDFPLPRRGGLLATA